MIAHRIPRRSPSRPTLCHYAHGKAESKSPSLWKNLGGAWYSSLGRTGSQLFDLSGKRNHGANTGATWIASRVFGSALRYSGSAQYSLTPANTVPAFSPRLTVAIWFRTAETGGITKLLEVQGHAAGNRGIRIARSGFLSTAEVSVFRGGASADLASTSTINDGAWHHLVLVQRATDAYELWIDGVLEDTDATDTGTDIFFTRKVCIGCWITSTFSVGVRDIAFAEFRDRDLTSSEIRKQYLDPWALVRPRAAAPWTPAAEGVVPSPFYYRHLLGGAA